MTHSIDSSVPDLDQPAVSPAPARSFRTSKRCVATAMMAILSARGTPARPLKEYLKLLANLGRLPELRRELDELKERLEKLESE